jgi:uncharacterized repeat protein (TIGR04138 family)
MSDVQNPVTRLLQEDPRYRLEAYQFVREALSYAQEVMMAGDEAKEGQEEEPGSGEATEADRHLTGQQLCEAIRLYALDQFGFMAQVVLKSWGVTSTSDFGEIVYNLIRIGFMKKSETDRREDFDDVYSFDDALREQFQITLPD